MGMYYDSASSSCKTCDAQCLACTGTGIDNCQVCVGGFTPFMDGSNKSSIFIFI